MAKNKGNNALVEMQKLTNQTQIQLQKMVDASNSAQMEFNREEAEKARNWQEEMSRKAHQMEVEDLKKAGLNPVLSTGGSGAQSYTTSSASTQNESGANALAALQSSQVSSIGNMESSRISAQANLRAAKATAAATKAAAMASAAAQKYAADRAYASSTFKTKTEAKQQEANRQNQRWIERNKNSSSWSAFLDKNLRNMGFYAAYKAAIKTAYKQMQKVANNPNKFFSNNGKVTQNNFKLNKAGQQYVNDILRRNHITVNTANRRAFVRAYVFGSKKDLKNLYTNYKNPGNIFSVRPGFR